MVTGTHVLLYSKNPEADRAFFRDVLRFRGVDAGEGWLIFGPPPAEMGIHPGNGDFVQVHAEHSMLGAVVYLICDDLPATIRMLKERGVTCAAMGEAPWGKTSAIRLPSGGEIGLYQPLHPTAI